MTKANDNRMAWVRNLNQLRERGSRCYQVEYEIATEIHIPGVLDYADGRILCGCYAAKPARSGLRKYLLKVSVACPEESYYNPAANRKGYLFRDGIPGELLALFSLFFQCRFYMLAAYIGELTPSSIRSRFDYEPVYIPCDQKVDPYILSGSGRNFAEGLGDFLASVEKLPSQHHQQFILSCHHYLRALREVGVDEEMVFIRLVSAIEALAAKHGVLKEGDDSFEGHTFDDVAKTELLSAEQREELERVFAVRKSRLKFIRFVEQYSNGFFHGGRSRAPHCRIRKCDLVPSLNAIYKNRSGYLHGGEPMFLSHRAEAPAQWDTDPGGESIIDNRRLPANLKLPYPYFFHRLVRHCLNSFLTERVEAQT